MARQIENSYSLSRKGSYKKTRNSTLIDLDHQASDLFQQPIDYEFDEEKTEFANLFIQQHSEDLDENYLSLNDYTQNNYNHTHEQPHFSQPNYCQRTQQQPLQSQQVFNFYQQGAFSKLYDLKKRYLRNNHYQDQQDSQREQRRSTSQNNRNTQEVVKKLSKVDRILKQSPPNNKYTTFRNKALLPPRIRQQSPASPISTQQQPVKKISNAGIPTINPNPSRKSQPTTSGQTGLRANLRNILKSNFADIQKHSQQNLEENVEYDKIRKEITELQAIPFELQTLDMYMFGKTLGQGATAEVKMAKHKMMDLNVAIKIYDKKKMNAQSVKNLAREVDILQRMHHPNIIRLYHLVETDRNINLIMEYTSPTCLDTFMRGRPFKRISEDEARVIFQQICAALCYLHNQMILHRDIKLENILIDYTTRKIKLIDFGYSIILDPNQKPNVSCGTPSYMAPEIVRKSSYSLGVDVWACGIILYKILTGVFPFRGNCEKDLFKKILSGKIEYPSFVSMNARQLISSLLRMDPYERPQMGDIVSHPWLLQ